jgi:hypothetical protein
MGKFFGFFKYLWLDGYRTVGAIAPLLSISFTLAKAFDVDIEAVRNLSYA